MAQVARFVGLHATQAEAMHSSFGFGFGFVSVEMEVNADVSAELGQTNAVGRGSDVEFGGQAAQ